MALTSYIRVFTMLGLVVAALVAVMVSYANPVSAQSTAAVTGTIITVNTKVDESNPDGDCSLREAIEAANTNTKVDRCKAGSVTEKDVIRFALGTKAKTIVLGSQLPAIIDPSGLRINDQKAKITISGDDQFRVFEVAAGAQLGLRNLTVADGRADGGDGGGGLSNSGGTVQVGNTTFSNNFALDRGAGISNTGGTLTVTDSTFSENSANNYGGGISNLEGTLAVTNSTFSENSAVFGGGIYNGGMLTVTNLTNSTFSENSATNHGGGIISYGSTTTLRNTIVANSPSGGNCGVFFGTMIDGGYNIEDGTSCDFSDDEEHNSLPSTDPRLANQLANNGGPTKTIALLEGSPAINAIPKGENGCGTEIKTDQRGVSRPQGSGCDIGAFERRSSR